MTVTGHDLEQLLEQHRSARTALARDTAPDLAGWAPAALERWLDEKLAPPT